MSRTLSLLWEMSFSLASLVSNTVRALEMPDIFASHMVLQRDQPIHVWGKAQPGSIVKITLAQQTQDTHADDMGKWQVTLPALSVNTQGLVMQEWSECMNAHTLREIGARSHAPG